MLFVGVINVSAQADECALGATNGELVGEQKVDEHAVAMVTGTPAFYGVRLYLPVSAGEVA